MRSSHFRITSRFNNDPHANNNNATHNRLKNKVAHHFRTNAENISEPATPGLLYSDTLTAPDGQVFNAASDSENELQLLMTNLFNNSLIAGGDCVSPTLNLFTNPNCLNHSSTNPQVWNISIILDLCNANSSVYSAALLQTLTTFCSAQSANDSSSSMKTVLIMCAIILASAICLGVGGYGAKKLCKSEERLEMEDADTAAIPEGYQPILRINGDWS
jgi:hypothetical protein